MGSRDEGSDDTTSVGGRVPKLIGARVRVIARRGDVVEGYCLDAWRLTSGGTALKIKPSDGSGPRDLTTREAVVIVSDATADSG